MKILDTLASGPQPWEGLLNGYGRYELDNALRKLLRDREIIQEGRLFKLRPKPEVEPPLVAMPQFARQDKTKRKLLETKRECYGCHNIYRLVSFPKSGNNYSKFCQACKTKAFELRRERNRQGIAR